MIDKDNLKTLQKIASGQITLKQRQMRKLASDLVKTNKRYGFDFSDVLFLQGVQNGMYSKQRMDELIEKIKGAWSIEEPIEIAQLPQRRIKDGSNRA